MTLLEFALAVVIMVMVLLGIAEFGWYTRNQLIVANAAREGARAAALGYAIPAIRARIINAAKPIAVTAANITIESSNDMGATFSPAPPDMATTPPTNGVPPGDLVRVTVTVTNPSLTPFPLINSRRITVPVVMLRDRT
jgi:Flp pilus assembly protein TadG